MSMNKLNLLTRLIIVSNRQKRWGKAGVEQLKRNLSSSPTQGRKIILIYLRFDHIVTELKKLLE